MLHKTKSFGHFHLPQGLQKSGDGPRPRPCLARVVPGAFGQTMVLAFPPASSLPAKTAGAGD